MRRPWRDLRQSREDFATGDVYSAEPLDEPFDGFYSARRGTYRIVCRIDEAKRLVEIYSIRHRRDAYRT
jgi:mRNA-degrading endonuclease RelE of RelBE toxin-antitoxin system